MPFNFNKENVEALFKGVYDGEITEHDLPEDLYYAIAEYLKEGLYDGFGGTLDDFEGVDLELLQELRENVYMFSGAKTYQQVLDMRDLLTGDEGVSSYQEFKQAALDIYGTYNDAWLKAEYDTAIGNGQNAYKWNQIEQNKATMPYLRYNGQEDDNECEICAPLNGLTAPVDDPVWDTIYPENHFRCRCTVDQIDQYEDVKLTPDGEKNDLVDTVSDRMSDVFKMNAGKDRIIFSDEHPYFDVAKGDRGFASDNFDLPIPTKD